MGPKTPNWEDVLPAIEPNKKFLRKQQYKANLQKRLDARETRLDDKSKRRKNSKSTKRVSKKEPTTAGVKKTVKAKKTVIANVATGQETMRKAHAKELVQKEKQAMNERLLRKQEKNKAKMGVVKAKSTGCVARMAKPLGGRKPKMITEASQSVDKSTARHSDRRTAMGKSGVTDLLQPMCATAAGEHPTSKGLSSLSSASSSPSLPLPSAASSVTVTAATRSSVTGSRRNMEEEEERALIARTIRGSCTDAGQSDSYSINDDPTLCPSLSFFDEYVENRSAEALSHEELLQQAHQYFKKVNKQDKKLYKAAAVRLKQLKEINRRGGDKDGFRYVVPRNVREMAEQMRTAYGGNNALSSGPVVDTANLHSTFDAVGVQDTGLSDKPMRRMRRRRNTFSDFYQFQVSKKWTRNAENFLKRGRANKSMFEAKKRQRSIRKL